MNRYLSTFVVLMLSLSHSSGGESRPPVPLRTQPLLVPDATAGSGLAPEATIRVAIDSRGVVEQVEVVSITPQTEHDALFRQVLIDTLSKWRYAPQLRDGRPEATRLEWRVSFPARPTGASGGSTSLSDRLTRQAISKLPGGDAEIRRAAILALPESQRLALLSAQVNQAAALLAPERRHKIESARFVVHSDVDDPKTTQTVANNLEAVYETLQGELLKDIDLLPEHYKVHVVVYRDHQSYQQLMLRMPQFEWSSGYYSPAGMIAFHLELATGDAVLSLMLHEATHAFMDRHVVQRGVALPRWLSEGFAEYVGNSSIRKGRLVPGKTVRRKFTVERGDVAVIRTSGGLQLEEAQRALRRGAGLGVGRLVAASPETFYGEDRSLFYASAWLLVHHLRDGGEGLAQERFGRLLLYLAEGYPAEAAFTALYGEMEAADAAFREYVRRF